MPAGKVLIENRGRDQKDFGKIQVKGEEHHVILGSADDFEGAPVIKDEKGNTLPGQGGQWTKEFPNPIQEVDRGVWAAYLNSPTRGPVIKSWLEGRQITTR